jgi:hypothetical protein
MLPELVPDALRKLRISALANGFNEFYRNEEDK